MDKQPSTYCSDDTSSEDHGISETDPRDLGYSRDTERTDACGAVPERPKTENMLDSSGCAGVEFVSDTSSEFDTSNHPGAERWYGMRSRPDHRESSSSFLVSSGTIASLPPTAIVEAELAPPDNVNVVFVREESLLVNAEMVVPPLLTKANLQLPEFPTELEKRFQLEHAMLVKAVLQISVVPLMAASMVHFLVDLLLSEADLGTSIGIRLAIMSTYVILLTVSKYPFFLSWAQPIVVFASVTITTGISSILYINEHGYITGIAGIGICIMASCTVGMMRFRYALVYNDVILVITNLMIIYDDDYTDERINDHYSGGDNAGGSGPTSNTSICTCEDASKKWKNETFDLTYALVASNFLLTTFIFVGLALSYMMELHLRHRFRDTGTIFQWSGTQASRSCGSSSCDGTTSEEC